MAKSMRRRGRTDTIIVALVLGVLGVQLWNATPSILPEAQAQIPDTGLQRKQLIDETRRTNELLTDILTLLREKPVKVRVVPPSAASQGG